MAPMKEKIKKVAINHFYKRGYFATGINDIARSAGIQKSSIYYHYANKEDILFDILKSTMEKLDAHFEKQIRGKTHPEERLRAAIQGHIHFHIQWQKETLISDSELRGLTAGNFKTILDMRDVYETKFQSLIRNGIEAGVFEEIDYKVASYALITMCTSVANWFRKSGRLDKDAVADIYNRILIRGLKPAE